MGQGMWNGILLIDILSAKEQNLLTFTTAIVHTNRSSRALPIHLIPAPPNTPPSTKPLQTLHKLPNPLLQWPSQPSENHSLITQSLRDECRWAVWQSSSTHFTTLLQYSCLQSIPALLQYSCLQSIPALLQYSCLQSIPGGDKLNQ